MPTPRHAALLYNPKAGSGRHAGLLPALLANLRRSGIEASPRPTAAPGHATELAREASASFGLVLAFGGDGTVREAAAGLLGTTTPLGILPGGTTNVLARAFGLPLDPLEAALLLGRLPGRPLDVGLAGEQPFLMMISAGLDAHVLGRIDLKLKRRLGQGAILGQGMRDWWGYGYPLLELRTGGQLLHGAFVSISNIPLYGGRFALAPRALVDDGWLDAVVVTRAGRTGTLSFALDLALARHPEREGIAQLRLQQGTLSCPSVPEGVAFQIDGDVAAASLPVEIRLSPHRLTVLAPLSARI